MEVGREDFRKSKYNASNIYIMDSYNEEQLPLFSSLARKPIYAYEDSFYGIILRFFRYNKIDDKKHPYYSMETLYKRYNWMNDEYDYELVTHLVEDLSLVPLNEWLVANGYGEYAKDTYDAEDIKQIEEAIKPIRLVPKLKKFYEESHGE